MILGGGEPQVIKDLEAGPFNTPEDDTDDFQMVDLDTGEVLEPLYADVESLDEELSAAFARLKEDSDVDETLLEDAQLDEQQLEVDSGEIDESVLQQAQDLDIDLSFMQKNTEELPPMQ
jgi:hypothetical protein